MAQKVRVYKRAGFKINDEMMNVIGVLARDLVYQLAGNLYSKAENYGVIVSGISQQALTEDVLLPKYYEVPQPHIEVSPGVCISIEKKLVVVSETLTTTDIPTEDKVLWLIVEEQQTEEIITHDIEGTIDYPVYINAVSLEWYSPDISPIKDGIKLGLFKAQDRIFEYSRGYRSVVVITGGLVWAGDEDGKVVNFTLTPSVEPGISLHRFLACKGHAPRTIYNPFGLAAEDIPGDLSQEHQRGTHVSGLIFREEGIYSNVFSVFRDKRYPGMYPKVLYLEPYTYIVFCVNQPEGESYYVLDDIYSPFPNTDPATNEKGYVLCEGKLRRKILDCSIRVNDYTVGVWYLVYLEYDENEDGFRLKVEQYTGSLLKDVKVNLKIPLCKFKAGAPVDTVISVDLETYNYFYTMSASRVRIYPGSSTQRFDTAGTMDFYVDKYTKQKWLVGDVNTFIMHELMRRRGVAPKEGYPNYESLKGNFVIYHPSAQYNVLTGHFLETDKKIELGFKDNDYAYVKVSGSNYEYFSFINEYGLNAEQFDESTNKYFKSILRPTCLSFYLPIEGGDKLWFLARYDTSNNVPFLKLVRKEGLYWRTFSIGIVKVGTDTVVDLGFESSLIYPQENSLPFTFLRVSDFESTFYSDVKFKEKVKVYNKCDLNNVVSYVPEISEIVERTVSGIDTNLTEFRVHSAWFGESGGERIYYKDCMGYLLSGTTLTVKCYLLDNSDNLIDSSQGDFTNCELVYSFGHHTAWSVDASTNTHRLASLGVFAVKDVAGKTVLKFVGTWYDNSSGYKVFLDEVGLPNVSTDNVRDIYIKGINSVTSVVKFYVFVPYQYDTLEQPPLHRYGNVCRYIVTITANGMTIDSSPLEINIYSIDNPSGTIAFSELSFIEVYNQVIFGLRYTSSSPNLDKRYILRFKDITGTNYYSKEVESVSPAMLYTERGLFLKPFSVLFKRVFKIKLLSKYASNVVKEYLLYFFDWDYKDYDYLREISHVEIDEFGSSWRLQSVESVLELCPFYFKETKCGTQYEGGIIYANDYYTEDMAGLIPVNISDIESSKGVSTCMVGIGEVGFYDYSTNGLECRRIKFKTTL